MQDNLYVIAEMRYQSVNKDVSSELLYPLGWEDIANVELKVNILSEAISKKILIVDTELYKDVLNEGRCRVTSINEINQSEQ